MELIGKNCLYKGHSARVAAMRDITERKQTEEALQKAHDELEERVKERTTELKETNTALKVLLKQMENDKKDFEKNILSNIKHLILPYIAKLKKRRSMTKEIAYLNVLESNLKEIVSPFSQKLSSKYLSLTPQEIKVANLIKDGIHDKDMAEILNGDYILDTRLFLCYPLIMKDLGDSLRDFFLTSFITFLGNSFLIASSVGFSVNLFFFLGIGGLQ